MNFNLKTRQNERKFLFFVVEFSKTRLVALNFDGRLI